MKKTKKKPLSVTVIAWFFIIMAGYLILSGSISISCSTQAVGSGQVNGLTEVPAEIPNSLKAILEFYREHYLVLAAIQVMFALVMLFTGISFLNMYTWARRVIEVISWVGLLYVICVGAFYLISSMGVIFSNYRESISNPLALFLILGVITGMVIWGLIFSVIIKCIRGEKIRLAFIKN